MVLIPLTVTESDCIRLPKASQKKISIINNKKESLLNCFKCPSYAFLITTIMRFSLFQIHIYIQAIWGHVFSTKLSLLIL
jgi:hypothetical protein